MHRLLKIFLVLILSGNAVTVRADTEMTDRYWEMFLAGNIIEIEASLDQLDQDVKEGSTDYGDQRMIYSLFSTTHPDILELLEDWRDQYPNSRHAMAGEMWSSLHIAWLYRGTNYSRYTYHSAMSEYRSRISLSQYLADELFKKHIDFVPGTDGKMVSLRSDFRDAEQAMDKVLRATPNIGSLERALVAFQPKWHGSADDLRRLCRKYAPIVSKVEEYPTHACVANAYASARLDGFLEKAYIRTGIDKHAEHINFDARMKDALTLRPDKEKALAIFAERKQAETRFASDLARMFDDSSIWYKEREREQQEEVLAFERDPNNPQTIIDQMHSLGSLAQRQSQKFFQEAMQQVENEGLMRDDLTPVEVERRRELNQIAMRKSEDFGDETDQKITELLERGADIGRFNPRFWVVRALEKRGWDLKDYMGMTHAFQMSVLYSNYMPHYVKINFGETYTAYNKFIELIENEELTVSGGIDKPKEIMKHLACEVVRAARLLEQHCKSLKYGVICLDNDELPQAKEFLREARQKKLCSQNRLGAIETLYIQEPVQH